MVYAWKMRGVFRVLYLSLFFFGLSQPVQAAVDYQIVGGLGQSRFAGDIADGSYLASGFGFNFIPQDQFSPKENLFAFFNLGFQSTESVYQGRSLGYVSGETMTVNKIDASPILCFWGSSRFQPACLGLGYSLIYFRQPGRSQESRGEIAFHYQLRYQIWKGIGAGIASTWISSQSNLDNVDYWSGIWTNTLFIGYTL